MSNGVAVMLDSSIHSGASPRGLYMTSLITICSALALLAAKAAQATVAPNNILFMKKTTPFTRPEPHKFR